MTKRRGGWCGCGGCAGVGWREVAVFLCACINTALAFMIPLALNTLFSDWQASFHTDRGTTASVQAVSMGFITGGGLIAGMLERKLGQRMSLMVGSFLSAAGYFAGGFANTLPVLVGCVGVVSGGGMSMVNLSNMSTALQRFSRRAGLVASGLALAPAMALLLCPFLIRYLTDMYTWRGCLLLSSGINFHTALFSLLLTSPLLQTPKTPADSPALLLPVSNSHDSADLDVSLEASSLHCLHQESTCNDHVDEDGGDKDSSPSNVDMNLCLAVLSNGVNKDRTHNVSFVPRSGHNSVEANILHTHDLTQEGIAEDDHVVKDSHLTPDIVSLTNDTVHDSISVDTDVLVPQPDHEHIRTDEELLQEPNGHESLHKLRPTQRSDKENVLYAQPRDCAIRQDPNEDIDVEIETDSVEHTPLTLKHIPNSSDSNQAMSIQETSTQATPSRLRKWARLLHFMTSPLYLAILVSTTLKLGMASAFIFLVLDYAKFRGWTQKDGLLLNFVFMVTNLVARVLAMLICLHPRVSCIFLMVCAGIVGSLASFLLGQVTDYTLAACAFTSLAVAYAWGISMFSPCVLLAAGGPDYPLAVGLCLTLTGISIVVFTRLAGFLVDVQGSYTPVSLVYGISMILAESLLFLVYRHSKTAKATPKHT